MTWARFVYGAKWISYGFLCLAIGFAIGWVTLLNFFGLDEGGRWRLHIS